MTNARVEPPQHKVLGLDVAVADALLVRRRQEAQRTQGGRRGLARVEAAAGRRQEGREVAAGAELLHEVDALCVLFVLCI